MTSNRKSKKVKPDGPSDSTMKKSPQAIERQQMKFMNGKSNSVNDSNKQFLMNTVIFIFSFFVGLATLSFLLHSPSIENLATVMPPSSMGTWQSAPKPFVVQPQPSPDSLLGNSVHNSIPVQLSPQGNAGAMFAHARSTEDAKKKEQVATVINMNTDFFNGHHDANDPIVAMFNTLNKYYYYDASSESFHLNDQFTTYPNKPVTIATTFQKSLALSGKYQPSLCSDGKTYGFSDLVTLRNAIHELSDAYSDAVSRWKHYNSAVSDYKTIKSLHPLGEELDIQAPPQIPEHLTAILEVEPDPYVICPYATLRAPLGRHMPININAEDVQLICDTCIIDTPGTHLSFGAYAKNVLVKGVTFTGATESSVVFRHNGADVSFEECYWVNNQSVRMHGAVADVNSTSNVRFFNCEISDLKQSNARPGMNTVPTGATSSLTLRG